ncbi:hypothetical protein ACFSM5_01135 [Lacibacterium aquatile]|uniref:Uncharacterized protein n=1 Tax=Lacibacterium aquatile TaxID=1168082 RepID=A0ABW5DPL7_9PROT
MRVIDLELLGKLASKVTHSSFGKIDKVKYTDYIERLKIDFSGLKGTSFAPNEFDTKFAETEKYIQEILANTQLIMRGGPLEYLNFVFEHFKKICGNDTEVFPIINSDFKSDAWLVGLICDYLDQDGWLLNTQNIGFTVSGIEMGEMAPKLPDTVKMPNKYIFIYVDDASYSGTQASNILRHASKIQGVKPEKFYLYFAGISSTARSKIASVGKSSKPSQSDSKQSMLGLGGSSSIGIKPSFLSTKFKPPIGSGGLMSGQITTSIKPTPILDYEIVALEEIKPLLIPPPKSLLALKTYQQHYEIDPVQLKIVKATQVSTPTFYNITNSMLPYKIPDSVSCPIHLFVGMDGKGNVANNGTLFDANGTVSYRSVLGVSAKIGKTPLDKIFV